MLLVVVFLRLLVTGTQPALKAISLHPWPLEFLTMIPFRLRKLAQLTLTFLKQPYFICTLLSFRVLKLVLVG